MSTVDVLWGWDQIAETLGISKGKAIRLHKDEGLPVDKPSGGMVCSTREALQAWLAGRVTLKNE